MAVIVIDEEGAHWNLQVVVAEIIFCYFFLVGGVGGELLVILENVVEQFFISKAQIWVSEGTDAPRYPK